MLQLISNGLGMTCVLAATLAQAQSIDRIAILGCHKQDEPAPALVRYLEAKPDLCLWIGDNVYADTEDDPEYIAACYGKLAAKPAFKLLRDAAPFIATWDDHDFGLNDVGRHYQFKQQSKEMFRKFWRLEEEIPADRDGIYYAKTYRCGKRGDKTLQIILLDPRYNRDDPSPQGDTLGEPQWRWLEEQLRQPADLRLLVSGYQVLLNPNTGSETWALFPKAQQRLFKLIKATKAEHLVLLTGDQHYGEVCRQRHALGYDAIELQFAGINQNEKPEKNTSRVSPVSRSLHSYCLLDIQWESDKYDLPHLMFQVFNADNNRPEVLYRVNFSELVAK